MKKQPLLLLLASFVMLSLLSAFFIANITGLPFYGTLIVLTLAGLIPVKNAQGSLLAGINITQLTTNLGAYFRKHMPILVSEILLGMDINDRFQVMDNVSDELPLPNLSVSDLVKPANAGTFSPTANALTFGSRTLKVRNWSVDLQLIPTVLEKTWLGAYKLPGSDPLKPMPFEAFIMQHIINKIHENIRLQSLFRGVYNAAGTTPIDVMDGVLTKLAAEITATNITPVVTGVVTAANVNAKILAVYDALGEAYKAVPTIMPVAPTIFDWYSRLFMPVLNPALVATDVAAGLSKPLMNRIPVSGTNAILLREPGMSGSQRIFCTPAENLVYGVDTLGEENNIRVQEFERTIKIMIDAKSGVEFKEIHSRALSVNDQA